MKYTHIIVLLIALISVACKKERPAGLSIERYFGILDSVTYECSPINSLNHITASINGNQVCYSDGSDGYHVSLKQLSYFTSEGTGTFVTQGSDSTHSMQENIISIMAYHDSPLENYSDNLSIAFPILKNNPDLKEKLEQLLVPGKYAILGSEQADSTAFNVSFFVIHDLREKYGASGYNYIEVAGRYGLQSDDSHFTITKVDKSIHLGITTYSVEAEFQCKLYHRTGSPVGNAFFGDLSNGKLAIQISTFE